MILCVYFDHYCALCRHRFCFSYYDISTAVECCVCQYLINTFLLHFDDISVVTCTVTGDAAATELGNGYKSAGRHKNWRVRDLAQLNAELRYVTSDRTSPVQRACVSDAYIRLYKSRQHDQVQRGSAATQKNVRYAAFSPYLHTVITLAYYFSLTNAERIIVVRTFYKFI